MEREKQDLMRTRVDVPQGALERPPDAQMVPFFRPLDAQVHVSEAREVGQSRTRGTSYTIEASHIA